MKLETGEISILFPVKLIKNMTDCAVIWDEDKIGEWSITEVSRSDEKENEKNYLISLLDSHVDRYSDMYIFWVEQHKNWTITVSSIEALSIQT